MKEFFPVLHAAPLFSGISDEELAAMLSCLGARIGTFPKGSRLLRVGDMMEEVGLVLNVSVERSGLSLELGKMRREWLLDFHKSHFLLKVPDADSLLPSTR